jgi:hypothetical protein
LYPSNFELVGAVGAVALSTDSRRTEIESGDVCSRAKLRALEFRNSIQPATPESIAADLGGEIDYGGTAIRRTQQRAERSR